jgi:hypothetical protein
MLRRAPLRDATHQRQPLQYHREHRDQVRLRSATEVTRTRHVYLGQPDILTPNRPENGVPLSERITAGSPYCPNSRSNASPRRYTAMSATAISDSRKLTVPLQITVPREFFIPTTRSPDCAPPLVGIQHLCRVVCRPPNFCHCSGSCPLVAPRGPEIARVRAEIVGLHLWHYARGGVMAA